MGELVVAVKCTEDGRVSLYVNGSFSPEAADALLVELKREIQAARDIVEGPFVSVRFIEPGSGSKLYSYRDRRGLCRVGDLVEVPTGYHNRPQIAMVQALGRTPEVQKAKIIKEVTAILHKTVL